MTGAQIQREMEELRRTVRARSSISGRWVSVLFALRHPRTTILERRRKVTPCDSAISYATEQREAVPGEEPLPDISVLSCELPSGHTGPHRSGVCTWPRAS